jgi:hypothetical protein
MDVIGDDELRQIDPWQIAMEKWEIGCRARASADSRYPLVRPTELMIDPPFDPIFVGEVGR